MRKSVLDRLYHIKGAAEVKLADDPSDKKLMGKLSRQWSALIAKVYEKKIPAGKVDTDLTRTTGLIYMDAVKRGLKIDDRAIDYATDDAQKIKALERNVYRFSAAKNFQEIVQLSRQLRDDQGKLRSFDDFKLQAAKLGNEFHGNYLRTEYNQAQVTATRIADYNRMAGLKDIYPSWQYRTRADGHVREAHRELHNKIFAASDPVWDQIYPPNGWNCRCWVDPVSDDPPPETRGQEAIEELKKTIVNEKTGQSEYDRMVKQGFNVNHAKTGTVFSKNHPYWEGVPSASMADAENMGQHQYTRVYDSHGKGWVDQHATTPKSDLKSNFATCKFLAEQNERVRMLAVYNIPGEHYPDVIRLDKSNSLWEIKSPITKNGFAAIRNSIKVAANQKAENVLIHLSDEHKLQDIINGLDAMKDTVLKGSVRRIQLIWKNCLYPDITWGKLKNGSFRDMFKTTKGDQ